MQYRYEDDPRPSDVTACMDGIRAGVHHLHALGLAHNDLNPPNMAPDKNDNPIILDFGSCRRFREQINPGDTPGWDDEDCTISARHHDEMAIGKLKSWLSAKESERAVAVATQLMH